MGAVCTPPITRATWGPRSGYVLGYLRHLSKKGLPRGAILVQTILHFLLRFGQGATVDPTLERLLGRPGRSVREYVNDHAQLWTKGTT